MQLNDPSASISPYPNNGMFRDGTIDTQNTAFNFDGSNVQGMQNSGP